MGSKISAASSEIKDLLEYFRKLEADVAILDKVNKMLLQRMTDNERKCWANTQFSRRECLEVVGIPFSVGDTGLEDKACQVFRGIGVEVGKRDIHFDDRIKKTNLPEFYLRFQKFFPQLSSL